MLRKMLLVMCAGGLIFAGYLSGVKLFSQTCALGETCPLFLGLPACYFGFGMYLTMTILAIWKYYKWVWVVSWMGIVFAGYFSLTELYFGLTTGVFKYALILPTCSWGLIFYIAINIISGKLKKNL